MMRQPTKRVPHPAEILLRWALAFIATVVLGFLFAGCKSSIRNPPSATAPRAAGFRTCTLSWSHPETNVTFNIYSGSEPRPASLRLRANTAAHSYTLPATNSAEFFGVKAVRDGVESAWGTTGK